MRFGRSSNSSDHQFPTNRHISRVHVTAQYQPPSELHASSSILVKCLGWNGAKVRCGGQLYELDKGDSWVSTQPSAEIMLDVMECRVMVKWPLSEQQRSNSVRSSSAWTEDSSPPRRVFAGLENTVLPSSPPAMRAPSPISPLSARRNLSSDILTSEATFVSDQTAVHVYEDDNSDHVYADPESPSKHVRTRPPLRQQASMASFSSSNADDLSDQENENEENDPVVHSFGPYGSNLLNRLDSFSHTSPLRPQQRKKKVLKAVSESPKCESPVSTKKIDPMPKKQIQESPVKNHVINQLAFSRVHAMPLSLIQSNLPADLKTCTGPGGDEDEDEELTDSDLRRVLHAIPCVGEINRQGKDAAGKPLENEFYYVPEMDDNTMRRDAVLGGRGGTGLRSVRKNHKVSLCLCCLFYLINFVDSNTTGKNHASEPSRDPTKTRLDLHLRYPALDTTACGLRLAAIAPFHIHSPPSSLCHGHPFSSRHNSPNTLACSTKHFLYRHSSEEVSKALKYGNCTYICPFRSGEAQPYDISSSQRDACDACGRLSASVFAHVSCGITGWPRFPFFLPFRSTTRVFIRHTSLGGLPRVFFSLRCSCVSRRR